jgi:glycosyltransferase involved in cell wall biosynthesis
MTNLPTRSDLSTAQPWHGNPADVIAGAGPVPRVSVIVPVYKVEQYLEQCVDSLVKQTLSEIEILLIDDGSPDRSGELADRLAETHAKVRSFHKSNGGLSDARNFGIQHARGDFVGFVDSDDWVDAKMFETLLAKATATGADIVVCGGYNYYEQTNTTTNLKIQAAPGVFGKSVAESPEILDAARSLACNKLFRRRLFDKPQNLFPLGQLFEDSAVVYNILDDANRVEMVDKPFYYYRQQRPGAITNSVTPKIFDIFKSCHSIMAHFNAKPNQSPEMQLILEKLVGKHLLARLDVVLDHPDKALARRFVNQAMDFMDENFKGWQSRLVVPQQMRWSPRRRARGNRLLAHAYIAAPKGHKHIARDAYIAMINRRQLTAEKKANIRRQQILHRHGYVALEKIDAALDRAGVKHFADFGTLLGFIRDNGFMAHDLDLDIGVIAGVPAHKKKVRRELLAIGCSLSRIYRVQGRVVEESYYFPCFTPGQVSNSKLKFDINYYENNAHGSKTWLFYRDLDKNYLPNQRDVVEMRYEPIGEITTKRIGQHVVSIPVNAERLLEQKYGPTWRIPDKNWIYWRSPAAHPMPSMEFFGEGPKINGVPPSTRPRLQQEQAEALGLVAELCNQHGLRYVLSGGTLLGAVRHLGCIPWHDTTAIALPRDDYDRLMALPASAWPVGVRLWNETTDAAYPLPYAKAVRQGPSDFETWFPIPSRPEFRGPSLNIIPLDRLSVGSGGVFEKRARLLSALGMMLLIKGGKPLGGKKPILAAASRKLSFATLHNMIRQLSMRDHAKTNAGYWVNWCSTLPADKNVFAASWFDETVDLPYAGLTCAAPQQFDKILSKTFGNYAQKPPIKEQRPVSPTVRYAPRNAAARRN